MERDQLALQIGLKILEAFELAVTAAHPAHSGVNPVSARRVAKNMNQIQLAELAGVSKGYISGLESGEIDNPGRRNLQAFNKVAKALECDPGVLRRELQQYKVA